MDKQLRHGSIACAMIGGVLLLPMAARSADLSGLSRSVYVDTTTNRLASTTPGVFVASKTSGTGETTTAAQDSTVVQSASLVRFFGNGEVSAARTSSVP